MSFFSVFSGDGEFPGDECVEEALKEATLEVDTAYAASAAMLDDRNATITPSVLWRKERSASKAAAKLARAEDIVERALEIIEAKFNNTGQWGTTMIRPNYDHD